MKTFNKKWLGITLLFILIIILSGCSQDNENPQLPKKCGDGICDSAEQNNPNLCPQDCESLTPAVDDINSFEECIKAGFPVLESYPRQCTTLGDRTFVEDVEINIQEGNEIPYYFLAIHNEPLPDPNYPEMTIESSYQTLKEIIQKADSYNMKLTLMFTAKWADYIIASPERMAELEAWKEEGHEIAIHHHSINHGFWGGYTDLPEEIALKMRADKGQNEPYLGTMTDFINKLRILDSGINSGCMNNNPKILLDEIIYSTGSGLANYGVPATPLKDGDATKGINEYITLAEVNGITRKYLAHAQITNEELLLKAKEIFESMNSNEVYGGVAHSINANIATGNLHEAESFMAFMDFLHQQDPTGEKSKTVTEVIEEGLLPEVEIGQHVPTETSGGNN